jgi:hypothetical protein
LHEKVLLGCRQQGQRTQTLACFVAQVNNDATNDASKFCANLQKFLQLFKIIIVKDMA